MVFTANKYRFVYGQEPHTNSKKIFPLELRAKTPAFTILLSILFLIVIEKYRTIYAYPIVFFQMFNRFFSLVCGGFSKQDESKISAILNLGTYTVAIIVLLLLFLIVLKASNKLRINLKDNSYILTMSTLASLLVIATYEMIS